MSNVEPMSQRAVMAPDFPYKHSTGETIGRFLAGLKEQKQIWGWRTPGQGVVVPPYGYSEIDGSAGGEWVAVKDHGVVVALAEVQNPIDHLHHFSEPFAFVLVKLDGADTAMAHVVKDDLPNLHVGARVKAVWAEERTGTVWDIACFELE